MNERFRKATQKDLPEIWTLIQQAILRRKIDGSDQWQDGYPNELVIRKDIENENAYVLTHENEIAGYIAILFNDEPAYKNIKGEWLTHGDFVVVHRLAISDKYLGKGLAQRLLDYTEKLAVENKIFSIKIDTNFDNIAMLKILEKMGYTHCGEVTFSNGNRRKAFEKVVS